MTAPLPPHKALTIRESRFVEELLIDGNAAHAAMRAGYSERTARSTGHQMLHKLHVAAAINAAMGERSLRTKIDTDWVVHELRELLADAIANKDRRAASKCLEQLGKHTGGFSDRLELSGGLILDVHGAKSRIAQKFDAHDAAKKPEAP